MTAVQKHQSQQQTTSPRIEPIAYRTNPPPNLKSQSVETTNRTFHFACGAPLEPQTTNQGQRRVPRAFRFSDSEAMTVPLAQCNRLPDIQPTGNSVGHPGYRQSSTSARSMLTGETRPPSASVAAVGSVYGHWIANSGGPGLQHLAAGALQAVIPAQDADLSLPNLANDISVSTRKLSLRDDHLQSLSVLSRDISGSRPRPRIKSEAQSPPQVLTPASGELPPLQMDSPKSEGLGQSLPSIRSTFGDINRIPSELLPLEKDIPISPHQHSKCPAASVPRLPPISASHTSPPISPNGVYHRNLPSPHSIASPGRPYGHPGSLPSSSNYDGCLPALEDDTARSPSVSTPSQINMDGVTSGQMGSYVCTFDGCNTHPFQTQYLLNSHANVHSSARPHYCAVKGCPRSEGGKGFKRKNEMIRHGLVHDSPGYVCPFCPDREHKYPRPDNLQRHVRVHHLDKDKDDPLLREVLSQRPDGPSRGRRRRGGVP